MKNSPGNEFVLAIDQGTTSSRAILYDLAGKELRIASRELKNSFPHPGWVEQDPRDIWTSQREALLEAVQGVDSARIRAIGLTNQRETLIAWDRKSGEAVAPAIVWQCRRSAEICRRFNDSGLGPKIKTVTGLVPDAYFSASKIVWLMENIPGVRERAKRHEVVFGTVDAWLLSQFGREEGREMCCTEPSNASRTMLMSLDTCDWDEEMLHLFGVERENLPEIVSSDSLFTTVKIGSHSVPLRAVLGDQQASLFGHGCTARDKTKCTFGTGAFMLTNTGAERRPSDAGMLETLAWQITGSGAKVETVYALEGSIFVAGALIQWLRDKLGIISSASESETLALEVSCSDGIVVVPAFVGLGAPHWNSEVRAAILGITRDSSRAHIARAALEAVAHQVADLLESPEFSNVKDIHIDGGMSKNQLFCQLLADLTERQIHPAHTVQATALGVACLAAIAAGVSLKPEEFLSGGGESSALRAQFHPCRSDSERTESRARWRAGIEAVKTFSPSMKAVG